MLFRIIYLPVQESMPMKNLFFLILTLCSLAINAQNIEIKGSVTDTLENPLIRATIILMDKDSLMIDYTQSKDDGSFRIKIHGRTNSVSGRQCSLRHTHCQKTILVSLLIKHRENFASPHHMR